MPDHVHMLINVPPKLAVSSVVGYIKGKSAIHVARHFLRRERHYAGQRIWAPGFFVDTVGRDIEAIAH
jgi:putative transposase